MRRNLLFLVGAFALVGMFAGSARAQSTTTGAIQGIVTDQASGESLPGVTVVASSPALQGTQSELTDASGSYLIQNLPPGTYEVTFFYSDIKIRRQNVEVQIGKTTPVTIKLNSAQAGGEVITQDVKAPAIDQGSTKQGATLDHHYLDNVPTGRTYEGAMGAAPGATGDALGVSFSGSTSLENNYTVDGINTTGLTFGTVGSPLLNNFIEEIEVITGGYDAEFGRSTGGVVNVVTKTGSNEFHGSVFMNFTPFEATRKTPFVAGSAISDTTSLNYNLDFGFDLGGPIVKDKVWFYVGFAPIVASTHHIRKISTNVDREVNDFKYNGKNNGGDSNAATTTDAGCEKTQTCESDGKADIDPATGFAKFEELDRKTFNSTGTQYQFTAKVNFAVNPNHQGQIAFTGSPQSGTAVLGVSGTSTAEQESVTSVTTDLSGKWVSKFNDNKTQVDVVLGWHRDKSDAKSANDTQPDSPGMATGDLPRFSIPNTDVGSVGRNSDEKESDTALHFCTDGDPTVADPFTKIKNCPLVNYRFNALGFIGNTEEQRFSGKVSLTQRAKFAGHHQFKLGFDTEDNRLTDVRQLTGGKLYTLSAGHGSWSIFRYIKTDDQGANTCYDQSSGMFVGFKCTYETAVPIKGETLNWSTFLQDKWDILPNLRLNAGVRYEQQILYWSDQLANTTDPATGQSLGNDAMNLKNNFAPRIGLTYDWTKEGRSKIYANYGRFYESIPMDINNRSFGGEVDYTSVYRSGSECGMATGAPGDDKTPRLPSNPDNCPAETATTHAARDQLLGGATELIAPGVQAQYLDEFVVGVEYEPLEDLTVGLSYQHRSLGRVIEDSSVDGANTYIISNPGEVDSGAVADLQAQADAETDPMKKAALQGRIDQFKKLTIFDKPRRDYDALQLTAKKRFSKNFLVQGSYTYSRLEGNYPGLFSDNNGQVDPNITSQYDLIELLSNREGRLPGDIPHNLKIDGYYTFDLKQNGTVTTGVSLRAQSGKPIEALGTHAAYGPNEAFVLPRGISGRTDFATNADLHVAYGRNIGKNMNVEVYFELFNVFNRQTQANVDQEYTQDNVNPIVGGDKGDLPYLKKQDDAGGGTETSNLALRKQNYGNTDQFFSPLTGRLGVRLTF